MFIQLDWIKQYFHLNCRFYDIAELKSRMESFTDKQKEAYSRAAVLCSRAEKSSESIFRKLTDWGLEEIESFPVIERLISEKFIDDERYARSYVRDKFRFNKWGKIKISYQLKAEKINSQVIEMALEEIDETDYKDILEKIISEKDKKIKSANHYDRKAKLFRFAQGRGFEPELIYSVINDITNA